jgi:ABC-type Fe3+/spermidine/putrescine transport system ATPase subunit
VSVVLELEQLGRRFGSFTAVDNISLTVEAGEMFGLLGPNGAGKSTTIKMLTTLLPPTYGTARIASFDIVRQAAAVRRVIGYVPQALSADGNLSGYENLLFFASNAIYPIDQMPGWLQVIARLSPLSYLVDALRGLMVVGGANANPLTLDFLVVLAVTTALVALGARLYPNVIQ